MKPENYSQSIEDYLKIIYDLSAQDRQASTKHIAEALQIKPASVTSMMQKLSVSEPPLVLYRKHHGVTLTPEGEKAALAVIRQHRLLESFLYRIMGFSWDEVYEEAHRLEHVISHRFEERMAVMLGNPTYDPHGDPIPTRDLKMPDSPKLSMNELKAGQCAIVKRVCHNDAALLRYLENHGVILNAVCTAIDISPFDNNIKIQVKGKPDSLVLSPKISSNIFIELV